MASRVVTHPRVVTHELMADALFDHHLVPYLSTSLKKEVWWKVPRNTLNLERPHPVSPVRSIFEEAHKVAELYYALASLSACNRYYRDKLKGRKKELADRIIYLLSSFPKVPGYLLKGCFSTGRQGFSDIIHTTIRTGSHHNLLKIYFYYKPQALHSFSEYLETPLHQAVADLSIRSLPFIACILELDKKLVQTGNHKSLLLVPDLASSENLMMESLIETSPIQICKIRPDHPKLSTFIEEQAQVKSMLAKHACDLGIENELIEHALDKAAECGISSCPTFQDEHVDEIRDLIGNAKKEIAVSKSPLSAKTSPLKKVETTPENPNFLKKVEQIPQKKLSSFCSKIYKALIYVVTCKWIADFIKFLKRSTQNK